MVGSRCNKLMRVSRPYDTRACDGLDIYPFSRVANWTSNQTLIYDNAYQAELSRLVLFMGTANFVWCGTSLPGALVVAARNCDPRFTE